MKLLGAGVFVLLASTGCSGFEGEPPPKGTIFFAAKVGSENTLDDLYAVDARTGKRRNLTRTPRRYEALPSVSPDGKQIAFYANAPNELNVLDLRTRTRTRLASGADFVRDQSPAPPSWSPDGNRIAFGVTTGCDQFEPCGRAEIWVVGTNSGRPVRLSRDGRVASWSPDGHRLAWWDNIGLEGVGSRAMVWDADTGRRRIVGRSWSPPVWRSNGTLVAGQRVLDLASGHSRRARTVDRGSRSADGSHVAFYDGAFTGVLYVRRVGGGTFRFPDNVLDHAWSPSGRRLAIFEPFDGEGGPGGLLSIVNPDGSGRRALGRDHRNFQRSGPLIWATRNTLVYGGHLPHQDTELFAVEPDGRRREQLTRNDISESEPVASPDGTHLAFVRAGPYYDQQIWLMRRDGSAARQLAGEPEVPDFSPTWSPNGDQIAFVRVNSRGMNEDGSPPDLFVMRSDGSSVRRLTRSAWATDPAWSARGELAYTRAEPDCRAIWLTVPGSDDWRLTDCDLYAAAPAWSPDGKKLAFLGRPEAEVDLDSFLHLYVIDVDEGEPRLLARDVQKQTGVGLPNDEPSIEAPAWSPDGQRLVYSRNAGPAGTHNLGLYIIGAKGGRPVRIARGGHEPSWAAIP